LFQSRLPNCFRSRVVFEFRSLTFFYMQLYKSSNLLPTPTAWLPLSSKFFCRLRTHYFQPSATCSTMNNDEDEVKASGRRVISATDHNVTYKADPNAQLVPQDSSPVESLARRDSNNSKAPGRLSIRKKPSSSEFSRQVLAHRVYSSQRQHQADRVDLRTAAVATSEPIGTVTHNLLSKVAIADTNQKRVPCQRQSTQRRRRQHPMHRARSQTGALQKLLRPKVRVQDLLAALQTPADVLLRSIQNAVCLT